MTKFFGPKDVMRASRGTISSDDLRNWVRDDLFNVDLPKASPGKPRNFPRDAVYEACFLAMYKRQCIPLNVAKAWNEKYLRRIESGELEFLILLAGAVEPIALSGRKHDGTPLKLDFREYAKMTGAIDGLSVWYVREKLASINRILDGREDSGIDAIEGVLIGDGTED